MTNANEPKINDLELLFAKQPPYSEDDLRKVIAFYREQRAMYAAGGKPAKSGAPKIESADLEALGLAPAKKPPTPGFLKL